VSCPFGQDAYFSDVDAVIGFEDAVSMPGNRTIVFVCEALSDQRIMRKLFPVNRSVAEFQHVDKRDEGYIDCGPSRVPKSNRKTVINFTRNRANVYGLVDRDRPEWIVSHENLIPTDYCDIEATLFELGNRVLISKLLAHACEVTPNFFNDFDYSVFSELFERVAVSLQYCFNNYLLTEGDHTFRTLPFRLDRSDTFLAGNTSHIEFAEFFAKLFGRTEWIEKVPVGTFTHTWINGHLQVYALVYTLKHSVELRDKFYDRNIFLQNHSTLTARVENFLVHNEQHLRTSEMFNRITTKIYGI
jgi:hypothetical protein